MQHSVASRLSNSIYQLHMIAAHPVRQLQKVRNGLGCGHQLPIPGETAVLAAQAQQRIFAEKIQQGRARVLQLLPKKPGDCCHIIGVPRLGIGALFSLGDFLGQQIPEGVAQEALFLPLIVLVAPGHGIEVFHDSLVARRAPAPPAPTTYSCGLSGLIASA